MIFSSKKAAVIVLLIFIFSQSYAQKRLDFPETYLGLQGGVTASMVNFSPSVDQDFILGASAGIVYRYIAHRGIGLQAELNYSQSGWTEKNNVYSRQLDYMEIPFMTHFYMGKRTRVFFNIGPKIAYLINETVLSNNTAGSTDEQHTKAVFNKFDYGFCGGPGLLFKIKKQIITLDLRANFSVSDIFSNAKRDYFEFSNNMTAKVNLGWQFQLK